MDAECKNMKKILPCCRSILPYLRHILKHDVSEYAEAVCVKWTVIGEGFCPLPQALLGEKYPVHSSGSHDPEPQRLADTEFGMKSEVLLQDKSRSHYGIIHLPIGEWKYLAEP